MGRVLSNNVSLAIAEEATLGVLPVAPDWLQLEPNSLGAFGASISTVVRNPISKSRQRKKGTVTDLDSSAEFEHDVVYDVSARLIRGFMFAKGQREDSQNIPVSAIAADGDLTVPAFANAAAGAPFSDGALMWLNGFDRITNNGMRVANADPAAMGVAITVNEYDDTALTNQVTGAGFVSACGFRFKVSTTVVVANGIMTVTTAGLGTAFTKRQAVPGMLVHIGSIEQEGSDVKNGYGAGNYGYARLRTITAGVVIFDKLDSKFAAASAFTENVDYIFGDIIKSVAVDDAAYLEQSYQFELLHPNLGDGSASNVEDSYVYSKGNYCNTIGINLPLTEKATISFNFVGTDTDVPTVIKATGAAKNMVRTEAFNTTSDIARLRIEEIDYTGITTDFKSMTLTINNNVSPEKVLTKLGARFMNTGEFGVSIETQVLFSNPLVLAAIRNNDTVSMDFILKNGDGVFGFDIPAMTLGGGGRDYPENESVLVNLTCETFEDDLFNSSVSVSLIPVPLP